MTTRSFPWHVLASVALVLAFHLTGWFFAAHWSLDLGSLNAPTPRYLTFVEAWLIFGGLAVLVLSVGIARSADPWTQAISVWTRYVAATAGPRFITLACGAAVLIPTVLRIWLLRGGSLTDDESAYRFGAELIAAGRLWVSSPPMKIFFDQNFMINDGRLYPAYFMAWPALLALGFKAGVPNLINPLLSAATIPPLARLIKRFAGPDSVRIGLLVFLASPFIQLAAATWLSHTSCLMALAWALMFFMTARDRADGSSLPHAGFGFFLALAFSIRPQATVPLFLPVVVSWLVHVCRLSGAARIRAITSFLMPVSLLAALFLATLSAQNGSPWLTGYSRYARYLFENDFRFATFTAADVTTVIAYDFSDVVGATLKTFAGMFRLNFDAFGWPSSFFMLAFAGLRGPQQLLWSMLGSALLLTMFQRDWGVDTFGPVHAFEFMLPVLLLTVVGAKALGARVSQQMSHQPVPMGVGILISFTLIALIGFVPVRLGAIGRISQHLNVPLDTSRRMGLSNAVVFAPFPFARPCPGTPAHFVFFRPTNDPDLKNDVLWVNHLDERRDRQLMASFPNRRGYLMHWTPSCTVVFQPLPQ